MSPLKEDELSGVTVPSKAAPLDEKLKSMSEHMQWSLDNAERLVADRPLDPIPLQALEDVESKAHVDLMSEREKNVEMVRELASSLDVENEAIEGHKHNVAVSCQSFRG